MRPVSTRFQSTHDVSSRDLTDRLLLLVAFLLGVFGTLALKYYEMHPLLVVLFPGLVLFGYGLACHFSGRLALEPESIGDNCYYLGFLFTLASLAYTLYMLHGMGALGGEDQAQFIPAAISGFGIALSSTIFGVFGRIFLMQLRPDLMVREREMRRDLAQSAGDFRRSAAEVSRDLKSVVVEMAQHRAEFDGKLVEQTNEHRQLATELLERQSADYARKLEAFAEKLGTDVRKKMDSQFDATFAGLGRALKKLEEGIEELSSVQARAASKHQLAISEAEERAERFSEVLDGQIASLEKGYGELSRSTESTVTFLAAAQDRLKGIVTEIGVDLKALANERLKEERLVARKGGDAVRRFEKAAEASVRKLEGLASASESAVTRLEQSVTASERKIEDALSELKADRQVSAPVTRGGTADAETAGSGEVPRRSVDELLADQRASKEKPEGRKRFPWRGAAE